MVMPGYRRRSLPGRVEISPAIKASFASDLDLAERRIAAKRDISPPDADHQKPSLRQWSSARPGSARPLGRLRSRRRTPIASSKSSSSIVLETAGWVVLSRCPCSSLSRGHKNVEVLELEDVVQCASKGPWGKPSRK